MNRNNNSDLHFIKCIASLTEYYLNILWVIACHHTIAFGSSSQNGYRLLFCTTVLLTEAKHVKYVLKSNIYIL